MERDGPVQRYLTQAVAMAASRVSAEPNSLRNALPPGFLDGSEFGLALCVSEARRGVSSLKRCVAKLKERP